jgi:SAM-dependent MidA family methyltransferase
LKQPVSLQNFRFVLSPFQTKAVQHILVRRLKALEKAAKSVKSTTPIPEASGSLTGLEVNAEAMALAESVALRIDSTGGLCLVIDYGQDGPYDWTLNAIREHEPIHPLKVRLPLVQH